MEQELVTEGGRAEGERLGTSDSDVLPPREGMGAPYSARHRISNIYYGMAARPGGYAGYAMASAPSGAQMFA